MDVARELGISRMTLNRDMHYINEMNNRGLFEMAKKSFATMYLNCVEGLNEILKECWKIYKNEENDQRINQWHKIAALRLANDVQKDKFSMFQNGPATMHIGKLHEQVEELRRFTLEDGGGVFIKRNDSPSLSPYKDFDVRDLDKP